MIAIPDGPCPFKEGDIVVYRPSQRGYGHRVMFSDSGRLEVGQAVKIRKIADGYIEWEGLDHPAGGIYWTEFSAI